MRTLTGRGPRLLLSSSSPGSGAAPPDDNLNLKWRPPRGQTIQNGGHHLGKHFKWRPPHGQTIKNGGHPEGKHFKMAANAWENISKWQTFQNDIYLRSKHLNMEDHSKFQNGDWLSTLFCLKLGRFAGRDICILK